MSANSHAHLVFRMLNERSPLPILELQELCLTTTIITSNTSYCDSRLHAPACPCSFTRNKLLPSCSSTEDETSKRAKVLLSSGYHQLQQWMVAMKMMMFIITFLAFVCYSTHRLVCKAAIHFILRSVAKRNFLVLQENAYLWPTCL